ncbi:TPA: phage holin family protein [Escherichia coli]
MGINFLSELPQIAIAIPLSLLSGVGGYVNDVRKGSKRGTRLELAADVLMALLVGILTVFLGQWKGLQDELIYGLIVLLSSNGDEVMAVLHPGSLSLLKQWMTKNSGGKND